MDSRTKKRNIKVATKRFQFLHLIILHRKKFSGHICFVVPILQNTEFLHHDMRRFSRQ
jgi:hypothetical protein